MDTITLTGGNYGGKVYQGVFPTGSIIVLQDEQGFYWRYEVLSTDQAVYVGGDLLPTDIEVSVEADIKLKRK